MKKRIYDVIVEQSLNDFRQMVFLSGPRQVGKTTVASAHADYYLNWDEDEAKATALRLGRYFKMEPQFWLNLQNNYDIGVAQRGVWKKIRDFIPEFMPLKSAAMF